MKNASSEERRDWQKAIFMAPSAYNSSTLALWWLKFSYSRIIGHKLQSLCSFVKYGHGSSYSETGHLSVRKGATGKPSEEKILPIDAFEKPYLTASGCSTFLLQTINASFSTFADAS